MSFLNGLAEIFKDSALSALGAGFQAMEDPQSFLRDDLPQNASPLVKWIQSRNRRACRRHARNEAAGAYSNLGALRRPRYERVCRPYLDSINEGPETDGSYSPPFSGGQCQAIKYSVTASGTYTQSNQCTNPENPSQQLPWSFSRACDDLFPIYGPITGLTEFSSGNGLVGVRINWIYPDGTPANTALFGNSCSLKGGYSINNLTVTRCDGQPDNCGDLPNEYQPPRDPPNLPHIGPTDTDNPPPGGDGEDDVEVDEDGNIRICENGDCSSPTSPGGGGDPSEDPGEEDGDPQENDPNNPQDGDITGCAEDGKILTGIKIEINRIPVGENPGSGGFYRNVCWIWMGPSQDQLDLVIDGRFLESGQFIIPDSNNCRCYRVRPSPLWGLSVQAYSRPEKED